MKRYYSHYTFIYPDIYLKNHVVELDEENRLIRYFLFDKEIERTEFYSGWLVLLPKDNIQIENVISHLNKNRPEYMNELESSSKVIYFR